MSPRPPLHAERAGPIGAPLLLFVHPNPMDATCWTFQMAGLSSRFRTVAVDLPGYGLSPPWEAPFGLGDVASACWEIVASESGLVGALVGCSVGAHVVMHMARLAPGRARALVLSGTGYHPPGRPKAFAERRIAAFRREGLAYRRTYFRENLSESFRDGPIARWFEHRCLDRSAGHLPTILALFEAAGSPDPDGFHAELRLPVLLIGGGEDPSHRRADRLAGLFGDAEIVTLPGAGHACHVERPWEYEQAVTSFLERRVRL